MCEDEFKNKVLEALDKIQKTQREHTEKLDRIDVNLKINSNVVCGGIFESLKKIEDKIDIGPRTNFQDLLKRAKGAVLS